MGREVKRVPMDFDHPIDEIWPGYLRPEDLPEEEADWWYEHGRNDPPPGEGWQLWETVTEGSPISPVFASAAELAEWMASPEYTALGSGAPKEVYLKFIAEGWAPSMVMTSNGDVVSGVEWVAATSGERKDDDGQA